MFWGFMFLTIPSPYHAHPCLTFVETILYPLLYSTILEKVDIFREVQMSNGLAVSFFNHIVSSVRYI